MDYKYSNHELTVQINISNREGKSCKAYTFSIIPPLAPPLPSLLIKQPQKKKWRRKRRRKEKGGKQEMQKQKLKVWPLHSPRGWINTVDEICN